jgi:hypothetical protein
MAIGSGQRQAERFVLDAAETRYGGLRSGARAIEVYGCSGYVVAPTSLAIASVSWYPHVTQFAPRS